MWSHRLQWSFEVLTELFDRFGLRINVVKTVSMEFQTCHTIGGHSAEVCSLMITGEVLTYLERLCLRFCCPEYGTNLLEGSLETHIQVHLGVIRGYLIDTPLHPPPPPTSPIFTHNRSYILPSGITRHRMPSGRVSGVVHELERPLGPLHTPPRAGNSSGPGGGEPPPPVLPQM